MQFTSPLIPIFLSLSFLLLLPTHALVGQCIFNDKECSCKFGDDASGTCFDLQKDKPDKDVCLPRFCHAGWTCSCTGRTNLCDIRSRWAFVPDDSEEILPSSTALKCHEEKRVVASNGDQLKLGTFSPKFSKKGLEAGACAKMAWYLDGTLMGNYGEVKEATIDAELEEREQNTLLHLRPRSLIAFRFQNASYHCYNSLSSFVVNGTAVDTRSPSVETRFARGFVTNWFSPIAPVTYADDELTAGTYDFVPLRTNMLLDSTPISLGADNWQPPVPGVEDHKMSNFYFRIQL